MTDKKMAWLDLETTGLNPVNDAILELGMIITDDELNILAQRAWYVDPGEKSWALRKMPDAVREMHQSSGLLKAINVDLLGLPAWQVQEQAIQWLKENEATGLPMCGSTIGFDRKFLSVNMVQLDDAFGYRSIDVSSIKELNKLWGIADTFVHFGDKSHRSLDDIRDSIHELKYYGKKVLRGPK